MADSQGHAVHVSARLGTETGVEVIGHAVRMGDAAGETEEKRDGYSFNVSVWSQRLRGKEKHFHKLCLCLRRNYTLDI